MAHARHAEVNVVSFSLLLLTIPFCLPSGVLLIHTQPDLFILPAIQGHLGLELGGVFLPFMLDLGPAHLPSLSSICPFPHRADFSV